jgi:tetratricopeptide (TPR) repeat protein
VARLFGIAVALALLAGPAGAQQQKPAEPPEEDESLIPKEYSFNPLQAEKELKVGMFYWRKGSHRAAARRFEEATRWNPGLAEAHLRLGEAREKLKDRKAAREAYAKFLELAPDDKRTADIKRRMSRLGKTASGSAAAPPGSGESPAPRPETGPRTAPPG